MAEGSVWGLGNQDPTMEYIQSCQPMGITCNYIFVPKKLELFFQLFWIIYISRDLQHLRFNRKSDAIVYCWWDSSVQHSAVNNYDD